MERFLIALACTALAIHSPAQEAKPGMSADKPALEAPNMDRAETAIERDHQFDASSGINLTILSTIQIENLVTLGKVWGFLKYHHSRVTSGEYHWDYELFRVLPAILAAHDHASANGALEDWIAKLGAVDPCKPCAKLDESDLQLRPDLDWIGNAALLGADLSQSLRWIRDNRAPGRQFYVSKVPQIGNPSFDHELVYPDIKLPDAGYQLLGLYRFWNVVEYWSPDRDLVGDDWNGVLAEFIPRIALASSADSYRREALALVAKAHDGHANVWNSLNARPPVGECRVPVNIRFLDNLPVVSGVFPTADPKQLGGLTTGDFITEIADIPVARLIKSWEPYYAASNEAARFSHIGYFMTRGDCGEVEIGVRREGVDKKPVELKLKVQRTTPSNSAAGTAAHDLPGPTFRLLSKDIAYLKLSSVKAGEGAHYVEQSAGTKGLIIDIRNYPSSFMVFALGSLLVDREAQFARFTSSDLSNPGAFHWTVPQSLSPQQPHYFGKVVILVDETSMSQAEYTAMAFRSAPGAIVVGSTTAGTDGNVSPFPLPGDLRAMISGLGVFYPDKTPTQRIGIVPNVVARPTIAGIRAGRDEVLEEALRQILGSGTSTAEIEKMAQPADAVPQQ